MSPTPSGGVAVGSRAGDEGARGDMMGVVLVDRVVLGVEIER